ncbi:MAG: nitroreductase family protein [Mogibacterium sp.]|nr:nitroreductase family protein [Mogibacterium sp.]
MKMEAMEVLKNRRAIRKFKAEQIKDDELNAVLEAGTFAPTGHGSQAVKIVAVQSPEYRNRVSALNASILGADMDPYYGAPTIVLIFETEGSYTPGFDGPAVTTNIVNAAYAAGLGSCWIHRCKQMFETEEGKALLKEWGLPEDLRGSCSVALGYADCEQPQPKPRKEDYIVRV